MPRNGLPQLMWLGQETDHNFLIDAQTKNPGAGPGFMSNDSFACNYRVYGLLSETKPE